MMEKIAKKDLPLVLQAMVRDLGLTQRAYMVLAVQRGQGINDSSIEATLGAMPVEQVPYHEGGGYRTRSPVFCAHAFGGKHWFGVAPVTGHSFQNAGEVAVACDHWLQVVEGEQAADRNEREAGDELARGGVPEEVARIRAEEDRDAPVYVVQGDFVINDRTGDMGHVLPITGEQIFAQIERGPSRGQKVQVGFDGELRHAWAKLSPAAVGGLSGTPPDSVMILMQTVEPRGTLETIGEFTLESMMAENAGDEDLIEKLVDLRRGQSFDVGGGAAPRIRLTRMKDAAGYVGGLAGAALPDGIRVKYPAQLVQVNHALRSGKVFKTKYATAPELEAAIAAWASKNFASFVSLEVEGADGKRVEVMRGDTPRSA